MSHRLIKYNSLEIGAVNLAGDRLNAYKKSINFIENDLFIGLKTSMVYLLITVIRKTSNIIIGIVL